MRGSITIPAVSPSRRLSQLVPAESLALLEIFAYGIAILFAAIGVGLGFISISGAAVLSTILLLSLLVLSWAHFDSGRHPCFLFLCLISLFQAGRLIIFSMGMLSDPFAISLFASFDVTPRTAYLFLFCLCLSAVCIYAPCRLGYRSVRPIRSPSIEQALPYLYWIFCLSLPFLILQNVLYFRYASSHGGYLTAFIDRAGLISSVPRPIHLAALLTPTAFLAIFVLEYRKLSLYLTTVLYFVSSIFILLIGARAETFSLIIVLWYISRMKSLTRPRIVKLAFMVVMLVIAANLVGSLRQDSDSAQLGVLAIPYFISGQGNTMDVTELAIQERQVFQPYALSYFINEVEEAFLAADQSNYRRGTSLAGDVTVFLNPGAYGEGLGTGSSFLGEAYVAGGIAGVMIFSLLVGYGLHRIHSMCRSQFGLFAAGLILPPLLWMARAGMFEWVAAVVRDSLFVLGMLAGWLIYRTIRSGFPVKA